jgi:hypothetical protein
MLKNETLLGLVLCQAFCYSLVSCSPEIHPHPQAHAHNDYENQHPLKDALQNGFISVEADVHLKDGFLMVSHDKPGLRARSLEELYLVPLIELLKKNAGLVYRNYEEPFYLMIDSKTDSLSTYQAIREVLNKYPALLCQTSSCPVKIFLSGNRPIDFMLQDGYRGIAIDGRPDDLGKGYSVEIMPVISDEFKAWSIWKGKSRLRNEDMERVRALAKRVHAEGKKLRLWAIPDNPATWSALLNAGVDFINTDHLRKLNRFLIRKGL